MRSNLPTPRKPRRARVPQAAYAAPEVPLVPDYLAGLPKAPGRCYSPDTVQLNCRGAVGIVCTDCALVELGEGWVNLKARTNAGTPKGKFYATLDREQARPDPEFARQQRWAREYLARTALSR